jgi:hypothetical protein
MPHTADRNLLLGSLALQTDLINRDALIAAMLAWSAACLYIKNVCRTGRRPMSGSRRTPPRGARRPLGAAPPRGRPVASRPLRQGGDLLS